MFGSKRITVVASSIYNLSGEYADRPNYMRTLLINNVMSESSFAVHLMDSFVKGPRANLRQFIGWSGKSFPDSLPTTTIRKKLTVDPSLVAPHIPPEVGQETYVEDAYIGPTDYFQWAEAHIYENFPEKLTDTWTADIVSTGSNYEITITFSDDTTETFTPIGFESDARYLYARHYFTSMIDVGTRERLTTGPELGPVGDAGLPNVSSYAVVSDTSEQVTEPLQRTIIITRTYSDGRPVETETLTEAIAPFIYDKVTREYSRETGRDVELSGQAWAYEQWHTRWTHFSKGETTVTTTETLPVSPTVTVEVETETTTEYGLNDRWKYRNDTYKVNLGLRTPYKILIYKIGGPNTALNALDGELTSFSSTALFPVLPVRVDGVFVDEPEYVDDLYPSVKKAYRKYTNGSRIDDLIEQLKDNDQLEDLDFIYLVFGVPLNTQTKEGKRYVFEMFDVLHQNQTYTKLDFDATLARDEEYVAYLNWYMHYISSNDPAPVPIPTQMGYSTLNYNSLAQKIENIAQQYDVELRWKYIDRSVHVGKITPDTRVGHCSVLQQPSILLDRPYIYREGGDSPIELRTSVVEIPVFSISKQVTDNEYVTLQVVGAEHENLIYDGKSVIIPSNSALEDDEDSGFLVPLYYPALVALPVTWGNQLSIEAVNLLINSYTVKKVKWYQRGFFKVLIAAVIAVVTGYFMPGGWAAGSGLLGTNAAVGAAVGASAVSAALVGAFTNAVVGAIVTQMVGKAATAILGDELGAIFLAVASLGNVLSASGAFSGDFNFDLFTDPQFISNITSSISNIYTEYVKVKINDLNEDMQTMMEDYDSQQKEVQDKLLELQGTLGVFDFESIIDAARVRAESRDTYLSRTMLTASDMRQLSLNAINRYAATGLTLPSALTT